MSGIDDVLIVGGSFAGLSAALPLLRARKRVRIIDGGKPRNRFASHAHTVFGFDGVPPGDILAQARGQVEAYPTLSWEDGRATGVETAEGGFALTLESGAQRMGRKLLLAHGVIDQLPDLPGFAACWGQSVIHCPYCHGYEIAERHWGVMVDPAFWSHMLPLYSEWTRTMTLFANGRTLAPEERAIAEQFGAPVIGEAVVALIHAGGQISAVETQDGRRHAVDALFAPPRVRPATGLAEALGCAMAEGPLGPYVSVDGMGVTSVAGVFAAGDLANPMSSVAAALGSGAMAGAAMHRALLLG
jgi:thioredoxin reductase